MSGTKKRWDQGRGRTLLGYNKGGGLVMLRSIRFHCAGTYVGSPWLNCHVCWRGSLSCSNISVVCPGELWRRSMKEATSASCPVLCRFRSFSRVCLRSTGVAVTLEFLGDHSFLTTTFHHLFFSWARWIQSTPCYSMSLRSILILFHRYTSLNWSAFLRVSHRNTRNVFFSPIRAMCMTHQFFYVLKTVALSQLCSKHISEWKWKSPIL